MRTVARTPVGVISRHLRLVCVVVLLALTTVLLVRHLLPDSFSSAAVLRTVPQAQVDAGSAPSLPDPGRTLQTEVTAVTGDAVVAPAAQTLGLTARQLREALRVTAADDADTFSIEAGARTPQRAQRIVQVVTDQTIESGLARVEDRLEEAARDLEPRAAAAAATADDPDARGAVREAAAAEVVSVREAQARFLRQAAASTSPVAVVSAASLPQAPDGLGLPQAIVLGLLLGALLGTALAYLRDVTDARLVDAQEVGEVLRGAPILAIPVPRGAGRGTKRAEAEYLDAVGATAAAVLSQSTLPTSVLLTTAGAETAHTGLTLDLAAILAQSHLRVVLVDGDARDGAVTRVLGLEERSGVDSLLRPGLTFGRVQREVADVLVLTNEPGLRVLPRGAGERGDLTTDAMRALLQALEAHADVVLVDVPSSSGTDGIVTSRLVDHVLLTVTTGQRGATADRLRGAFEMLRVVHVEPRVVLALETTGRRLVSRGPAWHPVDEPVHTAQATERPAPPAEGAPTTAATAKALTAPPPLTRPDGEADTGRSAAEPEPDAPVGSSASAGRDSGTPR